MSDDKAGEQQEALAGSAKRNAGRTIVRKIFIAVILGFIAGAACLALRLALGDGSPVWNALNKFLFIDITTEEGISGIGLFYIVGQLFMRYLQAAIVPLVLTSLSLALCSLADPKKLSSIAVKTVTVFLSFYAATAILASLIAYAVKSAGGFTVTLPDGQAAELATVNAYNPLTTIIDIIPSNMLSAFSSNNSILAVCFIAIVLGICMSRMGTAAKPLKDVLGNINDIINTCLSFVINRCAPFAIFCMITRGLALYGIEYLRPTIVWMATTIVGCISLLFIIYPIGILLSTHLNPIPFIRKTAKIALFGAATQSSAATLPLNMKTCMEELGCPEEVTSFVMPTGMTVHMNGTTAMQIIAVTFIATAAGLDMTPSMLVVAALISISCAFGTPPIPAAGTTLVYVVMLGIGLNTPLCMTCYSLVLAMNYLPGMAVMPMNVVGDAATNVIVSFKEGLLDRKRYMDRQAG